MLPVRRNRWSRLLPVLLGYVGLVQASSTGNAKSLHVGVQW
jgi:hypothetical protein